MIKRYLMLAVCVVVLGSVGDTWAQTSTPTDTGTPTSTPTSTPTGTRKKEGFSHITILELDNLSVDAEAPPATPGHCRVYVRAGTLKLICANGTPIATH